ncbi:MAG: hypothetical protein J0H17_09510 [Rhizobiales bacterium]|nr:hypothetical protein [Hyphomicrobiales bacterium]
MLELLQAETQDLRTLALIAGGDPQIFYKGVRPQDLELHGQNVDEMEFSSDGEDLVEALLNGSVINIGDDENIFVDLEVLIFVIKKAKRQEERLALLLKLILDNRTLGLRIVSLYGDDKAKYANVVLAELRRAFEGAERQASFFGAHHGVPIADEHLVQIIQRPFSRGMPGNRSALLYYMTLHLSKHKKINEYLRSKLNKSESIFIDPNRKQMEEFLDNPPKLTWDQLLSKAF